jgi:hypothetical protein
MNDDVSPSVAPAAVLAVLTDSSLIDGVVAPTGVPVLARRAIGPGFRLFAKIEAKC